MCTATWIIERESLDLFFNRDERRTRAPGLPPRVDRADGTPFLSPRDPVGGGSWAFVNGHGVAAVILNRYGGMEDPSPAPVGGPSRGLLLLGGAGARDLDDFAGRIEAAVAGDHYAPCYLLALEPGGLPGLWSWDGARLMPSEVPPEPPFTTAGREGARVRQARVAGFSRMRAARGGRTSPELLEDYHRGEDPSEPTVSVCLTHPEAWTVSVTRIQVDAQRVRMTYRERLPDGRFAEPASEEVERS